MDHVKQNDQLRLYICGWNDTPGGNTQMKIEIAEKYQGHIEGFAPSEHIEAFETDKLTAQLLECDALILDPNVKENTAEYKIVQVARLLEIPIIPAASIPQIFKSFESCTQS